MKTKLLQPDTNYYRFPEGIKTADEFAKFANNSSQKFVKLTMYGEVARFPYTKICEN